MATLGAAVPKAAVYENYGSFSRKKEIRNARNVLGSDTPAAQASGY
jgi:hypothetical protein